MFSFEYLMEWERLKDLLQNTFHLLIVKEMFIKQKHEEMSTSKLDFGLIFIRNGKKYAFWLKDFWFQSSMRFMIFRSANSLLKYG